MTETLSHIKTLMMIDDSEVDQMVYARIAKRSGIVGGVVQFTDASEALDYLGDETTEMPQLILLDINMPRMDGFEFLDAAQERFGVAICPVVVMLTSSLHLKDRERAESFEMVHDFLNKPLSVENLKDLSGLVQKVAS